MIRITIFEKKDKCIGFEVKGHAGYAQSGEDVICAATSVLAINTVNAIDAFTQDIIKDVEYNDDGYLKFTLASLPSEQSELLLNAFQLGIEGIIEQYGNDFIEVKFEEV